uniref:p53 DNA-binding domain-containing protein n=1 Tax=Strigamia maritima TaxID=126957 RepID=T1INQ8_STRMM
MNKNQLVLDEFTLQPQPFEIGAAFWLVDGSNDVDFESSLVVLVSLTYMDNSQPQSQNEYSEVCKRFYVSRVKKWPIRVVCEYPPPENCYIRAMLVFTQADHVSKLVERCPLHLTKPEEEDLKFPLAYVLRNTDENAIYQLDDSKRHSVAIPYTPPQAGNAFSAFYYSFGCLSTCVGGINRRPVKLVITLEEKGTILGRAAFDIKCSASPGRDRMADEKKIEVAAKKASEQSLKRPMLARQNSNEPATAGRAVTMEQVIPTKRIKSDGTIYTIQTDNEADYLILSRVANGLKTLRRAQMAQSSDSKNLFNKDSRTSVVFKRCSEKSKLSQPGPSGVEKPVKMEADSSQTTNSSGTDSQKQRTRGVTVQKIKITTSFNHEPSDI